MIRQRNMFVKLLKKRLINEHKYRPEQVKVEFTLQVGSNKPRADIVIWEKGVEEQTQATIKLIIECKKKRVLMLVTLRMVLHSSNPICLFVLTVNGECGRIASRNMFSESISTKAEISALWNITTFPLQMVIWMMSIGLLVKSLRNASDDNLLFVFKTCHNHIYVNDGMQKQPAFFELLKVIFCKIEDERAIPAPLEFYTTSEERSNPDGQLTVQKRISKIFQKVKKETRQDL